MEMSDIATLIEQQGEAFEQFKRGQTGRIDELARALDELHLKAARPGGALLGGGFGSGDHGDRKALDLAVRALVAGDQQKAYRHFAECKGMSVGSDPDGGYVVHPTISATMTTVMQEVSPVYRLARKVPLTTGDAFEEPVDREALGATWASEQGSRDETDTPQLKLFRVALDEIFTMPKVTQKLIDTAAIDVVAWLSGKIAEAFALTEGAAFHDGDGIGKPRGFLSLTMSSAGDATRTWGAVQYIATGASGAFPTASTTVNPADVLVDVVSAMKAQYRAGAVWLMNRSTAGAVRKLKDAEGRHVWVDSLVQGQPPLLLGIPVEIDEDMPDIGANAYAIALANLQKAYTIVEMPGVRLLTDPYTSKPHVKLFAYRRVGGGVSNPEAIKLLKFGTS